MSIASWRSARPSAVVTGFSFGPWPLSKAVGRPSASGTTKMSENRMAASKPNRRIGCSVTSAASFGL